MTPNEQARPLARKTDLVTKEVADEVLVYDLKTHQAHCLNQTAALIWKYCDGQRSVSDIAVLMQQEMNTPVDEAVVWLALDRFGKSDLLAQEIAKPETVAGISRRQMMRRIGWTAVMVPLVTSIIAPTAEAANTCTQTGLVCSNPNNMCCNKCCSGSTLRCANTSGSFRATGDNCSNGGQCCSGVCSSGTCT